MQVAVEALDHRRIGIFAGLIFECTEYAEVFAIAADSEVQRRTTESDLFKTSTMRPSRIHVFKRS